MDGKDLAEEFAQRGYVTLKGLFSVEETARLKREAAAVIPDHPNVRRTGVFLGLTALSPLFKEAAARPALVEALKAVIGPHVIFMNDKMVFKSASADFGSPWHQDYPYWYGSHKYSVWVALDDATPENGCLRVVPGSHLFGAVNHDADASDGLGFINRLEEEDLAGCTIVDLAVSRGDAILFHDLLYHASYPNTSGADRWALISTYKDGGLDDPEYGWAVAAFTVAR